MINLPPILQNSYKFLQFGKKAIKLQSPDSDFLSLNFVPKLFQDLKHVLLLPDSNFIASTPAAVY